MTNNRMALVELLQHAAGRSVDYRGNTARLSVEGISTGHHNPLRLGEHGSKDSASFSPSKARRETVLPARTAELSGRGPRRMREGENLTDSSP
jgi:hypothetical protein